MTPAKQRASERPEAAQVVASCHEWREAQKSEKSLAALKRRLADAVGPTLGAEDFQWPWLLDAGGARLT